MNPARIFSILCFIVLLSGISACNKDDNSPMEQTASVTINNADTLLFSLGNFGIEEGATIQTQASHYQLSRLDRIDGVEIVYSYRAATSFHGTDYVEFRSARGSDGASENNNVVITRLSIVVR